MHFGSLRLYRALCLPVAIVCCSSVLLATPGFGGLGGLRKKTLDLQTRQPALVRLANTSIAFKSAHTNAEYAPVVQSLIVALGTQLVSNEKTLIEKDKPEDAAWVMLLVVTGYSVAPPSQRNVTSGSMNATYMHWNGSLNAAYQVLDHSGRVHDASNISSSYNKEFPVGTTTTRNRWTIPRLGGKHNDNERVPSSPEDVKQILIADVVQQIAAKLGNTTKPVEVEVATGDAHLDRAAEFLEQQLWTRALDELEKTPAFPKPEQEAYRQYDLGLAYEAISYTAAMPDEQKENIFKAAEYYDKALEMNEKEKYFVATVARTRDALARYKELDAQNRAQPKVIAPDSDASASSKKPAKLSPDSTRPDPVPLKTMKADDVIQMYSAKVSQEEIIDAIKNSTVEFNPYDKDTLIAIRKANLPIAIQNALRQKAGVPLIKSSVAKANSQKPE